MECGQVEIIERRFHHMKLNYQVKLYPNKTMKHVLDSLCDYRRYCWNKAISCWNEQYESRLIVLQ